MSDAARLCDAVEAVSEELWNLNVFMHDHVETAFEERAAASAVTRLLERHGFEVQRGLAGYDTAFRGTIGASEPSATIAFVCEYDGLPPYGQSCGHNIVTASSVGAGIALGPLADRLGIRIQVIGTPGEEGGGGKYRMADEGVFDAVDVAMLVYPGMYDIGASRSLAALAVRVEFTGRPRTRRPIRNSASTHWTRWWPALPRSACSGSNCRRRPGYTGSSRMAVPCRWWCPTTQPRR